MKGIISMKGQEPPRVAICIPSGDEMKADTATALALATVMAASKGINVSILNPRDSIIARARNEIVEGAQRSRMDYLFWIDSDMTFPADIIPRLLKHGKSIVGCFYSQRIEPYEPVGTLINPGATSGLHEASRLGGGCLLVKADVYRNMPFPWYFEVFRWDGTPLESFKRHIMDTAVVRPSPEIIEMMTKEPAVRKWIEENHAAMKFGMIGEDWTFCKKAKDHGCKLWVDLTLSREIGHIGTKTFEFGTASKCQAAAA